MSRLGPCGRMKGGRGCKKMERQKKCIDGDAKVKAKCAAYMNEKCKPVRKKKAKVA